MYSTNNFTQVYCFYPGEIHDILLEIKYKAGSSISLKLVSKPSKLSYIKKAIKEHIPNIMHVRDK
jgi:hypothetical protein